MQKSIRLSLLAFACVLGLASGLESTCRAAAAPVIPAYDYLSSAREDINSILSLPALKDYSGYNVVNIRQGEIGESMAYFLTLQLPFSGTPAAVCFIFQNDGQWKVTNGPTACED